MPYEEPLPRVGTGAHRYALLLYHQLVGMSAAAVSASQPLVHGNADASALPFARERFNSSAFAARNGLDGPIAAVFFLAES